MQLTPIQTSRNLFFMVLMFCPVRQCRKKTWDYQGFLTFKGSLQETDLLEKQNKTQGISQKASVFHLFSSLFVFTSFPEVVMCLVPGDIFYELMHLSALLYWKRKNESAVQRHFTLDLLLFFNPISSGWFGLLMALEKGIKKTDGTSPYYAQAWLLEMGAGRRVIRLKCLLFLALLLTG